jgi:RHS repeat-associated protein
VGSDSTFLHSGIKNADTQTDDGGDVSAIRRYDAFGNPLASWGGWQGPFGYGGPYGYQTDPDHGLMLLGHRYYEADTGRFLTRDPIKDGRNWYGYCDGNPLAGGDPTGLVKIIVFWYPVAGAPVPIGPALIPVIGYHAGIILIDNVGGRNVPTHSFSGGLTSYPGRLISRSGPWKPGTQDYGKWTGGGVILLDNQSPAQAWIDLLDFFEREMAQGTEALYDPLPAPFENWTGNSNTWAAELIRRAGLLSAYEHAIKKRGGSPWVPGWGKNVWQ